MPSALCLCLIGCNAVGAILYKFSPPPTIYAKYTPPSTQPAAIIVQNVDNPGEAEIECQQIARMIGDDWTLNKVSPLVDPNKISDLHDRDPAEFHKMTPADIGRAVGAQQVILVDVHHFILDSDTTNQMAHGLIDADVRVFDVATGDLKWPDVQTGYPITSEIPLTRLSEELNATAFSHNLQQQTALQISTLFYKRLDYSK